MNRPHPYRFATLVALLSLAAYALAAGPSTKPAKPASTTQVAATSQSATKPLTEKEKRRKVMDLTRKSIDLMGKKKYAEAEPVLEEALALDPDEPTNLYNMACLQSLTGHKDAALNFLERSADAGFTDFIHIANDTDLVPLRDEPRYKAFIAKKDEYQRKAADLVMKELKKRFGEDYLYEMDEQDKLIFATNTDQQTLNVLKDHLIRQAHSQWAELFEHKPDQYIAVVVPSPVDYRKIMPMPGVEGFYNHQARTLIAKGLGFVTTHEFTHALHAADLDPIGQEHPIWLVEGMAVLWERCDFEPVGAESGPDPIPEPIQKADEEAGLKEHLVPHDGMRLFRLQAAARQNRLIPLEKIFKMEQPEFVAKADLCYAESGSVIHYLYTQGLLRKFYDEAKKDFNKDKTARAALEKTVGKPLAEFEADWKAWMMKRVAPPIRPGPNDPYLGVVFGSANDGLQVRTVVAAGPAFRAGVKVGDVIVGIDDLEVRDEAVFVPLLASHKPGDTVTLKVRRDRKYMEIPMILGNRKEPRSGGAAPGATTNKSNEVPPSPPVAPPAGARRDAD